MYSRFGLQFLFVNVILFLITSSFTLHTPSLIELPQQTSSGSINFSNATALNVTETKIICNGRYGRYLQLDSCVNAWRKIDLSTAAQRFVPRQQGGRRVVATDMEVPIRFLSDDGVCAIDLARTQHSSFDFSTGYEISQNAATILDKCVEKSQRGGTITGFST